MRAVMFRGPDKPITVETMPEPTPAEGQMILKVGRCGICGSDVHLTEVHGFYPVNQALGHEFAGEVVALGKGVENCKVGDIVTAMPVMGCGECVACVNGAVMYCQRGLRGSSGGFAEYIAVTADAAIKLPSILTLQDGALVEPLSVGLHGVGLAKLQPGCRVLVTGAGAIGLGTAYWARLLGAGRIAIGARSRVREQIALGMGADVFVSMGTDSEVEDVQAALGGPPDVVFECVGSPGALQQACNHVRAGGTVISLGTCSVPDAVIPILATFKQVRIQFSMAYNLQEFQYCVDTLDRGHVEPRLMVNEIIRLEDVPGRILDLRSKKSNDVKVQADPWL